MLNDLYFKTTCNIRPHFLGLKGCLKIEGPLHKSIGSIFDVNVVPRQAHSNYKVTRDCATLRLRGKILRYHAEINKLKI